MNTYKSMVRPLLFGLSADRAHDLGKAALRRRHLWAPLEPLYRVVDRRLHVDLGGVEIQNPVGLAPGLDKNCELLDAAQALGFGFAVPGSIRGIPAGDNPRPRHLRYIEDEAIINCTGFPSKGAAYAARRLEDFTSRKGELVVVPNVTGFSIDESVEALNAVQPFANAIEFSLSCPNEVYPDPDKNFLVPETFNRYLDELNKRKKVPFFVKIRKYNNEAERVDRLRLVEICLEHGIDAIHMPGTQLKQEPRLSIGSGSMGGRPVFQETTLPNVRELYAITSDKVALVALGGVFTAEDAYAAIAAGASAVQLLTSLVYEGPGVARRINRGLLELMEARGIEDIAQLRGSEARSRARAG